MDRLSLLLIQSFEAVKAFKLRTFFCLVSVALGISAITIIVAATEGAYKKAYDIVASFGPDSVMVMSGSEEARAIGQRDKTITLDDVEAIRQAFPTAYVVVPSTWVGSTTVSYRGNRYQSLVVGSSSDFSRAWTWPVVEGSDFTDDDIRRYANVGLIGQEVARELFGNESPVGKFIQVRNLPVQIVGVLQERGTTAGGGSLDNRIILPYTTVMKKIQNEPRYVVAMRLRFTDLENVDLRVEELKRLIRYLHRIPDGQPDDFRIFSSKDIVNFLVALTGSLVVFIGIVGVISLIVAGFVLANLFLLSVKERVKEIGIRRSVGARRKDIMIQFLTEAVMITTAGGVVGFILGVISAQLLTYVAEFPVYFSWKAFAIGLVLSWAIGIGFGLHPARQAANLEPIEAIRA
ncbi:MAG TPA: ABC transporter permease [Syntrophales bacterium]|nr:ABC transporter permease [Syntrophales bacterium]HOX94231.1 ABC transporter permease [Syntrophales bacterium]HPI55979.1 ABC transporter permease [Syntrophales bacterium]HPN24131.1 ABC transporter permease [Syntrophales bacterium]HQM28410.1 ABC transporter permease [Syntrophales bacterium]